MKQRPRTLVTAEERERVRALRRQGLPATACGRIVGRHASTAWNYTHDIVPHREPDPKAVDRARRIERFFAACNRVIAEARA